MDQISLRMAFARLRNSIDTTAGTFPSDPEVDLYYGKRAREVGREVGAQTDGELCGRSSPCPALKDLAARMGKGAYSDMNEVVADHLLLEFALLLYIQRTSGISPKQALDAALQIALEEGEWDEG